MDTSRWRTITWFVFAALMLCMLAFAHGLSVAPSCDTPCSAPKSGAARTAYEVGYRSAGAMKTGDFLITAGLLILVVIVWLAATVFGELRRR